MRRTAVVVGASILVSFVSPAGRAAPDPLRWLPRAEQARTLSIERTLTELRASFDGRTAAALAGSLSARGLDVASPDPPAGAEDLAAAIEGLRSAVDAAASTVRLSPQGDGSRWTPRPAAAIVAPARRLALNTGGPPITRPMVNRATAERPPSPSTLRAALRIGAAMDRLVAALDAVSPVGVASDDPCDIVDQPPLLCVSSEASHTYTKDVALTIDFGGDDTYLNSAAGAPFALDAGGLMPVAIVLDAAGNDLYRTTPREGEAVLVAQGAGALGGVGILVDLEGDDRYEAAAPDPETLGGPTTVVAQGAGSNGGIGAVLDLAGNDSYAATLPGGTRSLSTAFTQASGILGGVGLLADEGGSDDRYAMTTAEVAQTTDDGFEPMRVLIGQGSGDGGGIGILSDGGGNDRLEVVARARWPGQIAEPATPSSAPKVIVEAQGAGNGGTGIVLAGAGDTIYRVDAAGLGWTWNLVNAQGYGSAGVGAIDDAGGDDRYEATSRVDFEPSVVVGDACGASCNGVHVSLAGIVNAFQGQGGATQGGAALVRDRSGNDVYLAASESRVHATIRDVRKPGASPLQGEVWSSRTSGELRSQGQGDTAALGVLLDESGTDSYTTRYLKETQTLVTAPAGASMPVIATTSWNRLDIEGQGAGSGGVGALLDLGGFGDRFLAQAESPAASAPDPDAAFEHACCWPNFQGSSSDGFGVFVALGTDPAAVAHPRLGVCPGGPWLRGRGTWLECPVSGTDPEHQLYDLAGGPAFGTVPKSWGLATWLAFTPADPVELAAGPGRVAVAALLLDTNGRPIAGAPLRFDLQFNTLPLAGPGGSWANGWEVSGITDPDGMARVRLPLNDTDAASPGWEFRVLASFEGGHGLHPSRAVLPLTIRA